MQHEGSGGGRAPTCAVRRRSLDAATGSDKFSVEISRGERQRLLAAARAAASAAAVAVIVVFIASRACYV